MSKTGAYLRRYHQEPLDCNLTPQLLAKAVSLRTDTKQLVTKQVSSTKSYQWYFGFCLNKTRDWMNKVPTRLPRLAMGFHWLMQMRVNCFWSCNRLAGARFISDVYTQCCPFCHQHVAETTVHLLLDCAAWATERVAMNDIINEAKAVAPIDYEPRTLAALLLGGEVAGRGVSNWTLGSDESSVNSESLWDLGCVKTAKFLQLVQGRRLALLKPLRSQTSPEGQSPGG